MASAKLPDSSDVRAMSPHVDVGLHSDVNRSFKYALILNVGFVVAEFIGGMWSGSLALLADAAHNLTDVLGLVIAWGALFLGRREPSKRFTYGLGRASILSAMVNAVLILVGVGALSWEAFQTLFTPQAIPAGIVVWVALIGVAINGVSAFMLSKSHKHDLNLRGAYLHMLSDTAVSVFVVLSALAIMFTGWYWLDPLSAILIGFVISWAAFKLLVSAVELGMDKVPPSIDIAQVETWLFALPEVSSVHDLHVWALSTTKTALTVHLEISEKPGSEFLRGVADGLDHEFGIGHATIQVETAMQEGCATTQCAPNGP